MTALSAWHILNILSQVKSFHALLPQVVQVRHKSKLSIKDYSQEFGLFDYWDLRSI